MTNFYLLKPSLSQATRDASYITSNGLDLGKEPTYDVSGSFAMNNSQELRLTWKGLTISQKELIEIDFDLERNLGSAYFYDTDGDLIFIDENIQKFFIDNIEYEYTEAELYNITMSLKHDRL
jgi:hypothetical protein